MGCPEKNVANIKIPVVSISQSVGEAINKSMASGKKGVKNVEVDLNNQVVRILGIPPVKTMTKALEQTGRKARLIGQGVPEDFLVSAAVAEFKGPEIFGVARLASFSGLPPENHSWSINEYGELTRGPESTGKVFNPTTDLTNTKTEYMVDMKCEGCVNSVKNKLQTIEGV